MRDNRMRQLLVLQIIGLFCTAGCIQSAESGVGWADGADYMVAADHAAASQAGAQILAAGGNAIDAAVATSFALAVVRPESCGLGGGGFMLIYRPGYRPIALDYRETVPSGATLTAYLDPQGTPIPDKTKYGAWAVGIPGTVRGLLYAFETYGSGRLTRQAVLQPAMTLARRGFSTDQHLHDASAGMSRACRKNRALLKQYATLCDTFLCHGDALEVGGRVDRSSLAATLQAIVEHGADGFYDGPIAEKIIADIQRRGGPMTRDDLRRYQVRTLKPIEGRFRRFRILGMPLPSSGGAAIIQVLNTLSARPADNGGAGTETDAAQAHLLIESMKHAFANRARFLGDRSPAGLRDAARMIDPAYARDVRASIATDHTMRLQEYGLRTVPDDGGTSHFCVVDRDGMAVACTESINTEFGSRIMPAGTGVILNNTMDDFAVDTHTPNAYGLLQSERNLIRPGARPLSSMSPTIVLKDGCVQLVVGASGGPKIITSTLQTLLHVFVDGQTVDQAIRAPRLHHQWLPDRVDAQPTVRRAVLRGLLERGHVVRYFSGDAGNVQAIGRLPNGRWRGACDPNKGGRPAGH